MKYIDMKRVEFMKKAPPFGIRRQRYGGWMVYNSLTNEIVMINLPTRLRAYYVAGRYMGVDMSVVFNFGDML